ncbi:MAG: hypothetical protein QOH61_327 [Chloroflexota bacterium]|nr:hypothetical protein [Chloroflexota bacterium]
MHSSLSIEVESAPETVFELARDVSRWPALLPHYRRAEVRARSADRVLAQFVAVRRFGRLPLPVTWRAVCWAEAEDPADLRLRFLHVRGVTRGMRVTWHIRPLPGEGPRSRVTIEHDFERGLPLLSVLGKNALPAMVDRGFTRPIATRTLRTFKALAEAETETSRHPDDRSATNLPL